MPAPVGLGATFSCDGTAMPLFPAICAADVLFGSFDGKALHDFELVNAAALYQG